MKPVNEWDFYVMMFLNHNLTPAQVDALDPDFVDTLTARMEAEDAISRKPKK